MLTFEPQFLELHNIETHIETRNGTVEHPSGTDRLFEVSGYTLEKGETREFTYLAKNIVLATGSTDVPNSLGVPGEDEPFVLHSLKDLEAAISRRDLTASASGRQFNSIEIKKHIGQFLR